MRKMSVVIVVLCCVASLAIVGCGAKKAASGSDAIEASKSLATVEAKAGYLVGQARAFYNSKDFQEAISIAQYVLVNIDKDSQEAKKLLEQAKADLAAMAQKQMEQFKNKLGNIGGK